MLNSPEHSARLYTVGHGTRSLDDLVALLRGHGIRRLVDVRTIPRSRHNPQFNRETLGPYLRRRRIGYRHMPALGGLRHTRPGSPNLGWRNASFRGFADYMQTPAFTAAAAKLIELVREKPTVIMCAESVPWRCHRSLIADAITIRGIGVFHIYGPARAAPHQITRMARVQGTRITYPPPPDVKVEQHA